MAIKRLAETTYGGDREEYDIFISHAWEDKEAFVDDFVAELSALDIKVWYDKQQIAWGDSMRAKIDKGLVIKLIYQNQLFCDCTPQDHNGSRG